MGLRQLVVLALAAWFGWLLVRGLIRRRVPWIGLALLVVPMLWLGITERQWMSAEHAFSAAARSVAPGADGVHCQRLGETFTDASPGLGHVWFDEGGTPDRTAVLSYETCGRLSTWWRSAASEKGQAPLEQVVALHTLTHEAVHLSGERSEALTECRAMQLDEALARALGAPADGARLLAVRYATEVYPRMPADYRSDDCRPDGPLDLTPGDQRWP